MLNWNAPNTWVVNSQRIPVMMNDLEAILDDIRSGNPQALRRLYDACGQLVYSLAFAITQNQQTAEDITQDVFLKVWNQIDQYDAGTNFRAWLARITRNHAIDRIRREKRQGISMPSWEIEIQDDVPEPPAQDDVYWIRKAIHQLTTEQRQAIELAYLQGFTHEQIADRLNTPLGTIKTRIRDGLKQLRQLWQYEGME
jgi:RNA polymerase sigma-70 factor, ECF subfamily